MHHVDCIVVVEYQPPYFSSPGLYVDIIIPCSHTRGQSCYYTRNAAVRSTRNTHGTKFSRLVMFWRRECTT